MSEDDNNKPKSELEQLKLIFDSLDKDSDGTVPLKDFHIIIEDSETAQELTDVQRQTLLRRADKNKDGTLDFREFALLATSREAEPSPFRRFLYRLADLITPYDQRPTIHSYLSQYSCCPPPAFMITISIIEVVVFLYYTLSQGMSPGWLEGCGGCYVDGRLGPLPFSSFHRNQAWRFVSYMLVHAGIQHLLGNLLFQLLLGIPLELVHKIWRIAPLYILGVILGSMLQYSLDPNVLLVGASGGVYALIFAHLANLILNWAEMPFRWFRLGGLIVFIGFDIGHVIYRRIALNNCDAISYAAHIGGALAGLLLGIIILKNINKLKWENIIKWVGMGLFILIMIALSVMTIVIQPGEAAIFTTKCEKN